MSTNIPGYKLGHISHFMCIKSHYGFMGFWSSAIRYRSPVWYMNANAPIALRGHLNIHHGNFMTLHAIGYATLDSFWTLPWWCHKMETFCALLAFCVEKLTDNQWIPLTKASDAERWCLPWSAPEKTVEKTIYTLFITPSRWLWRHWNVACNICNGHMRRRQLYKRVAPILVRRRDRTTTPEHASMHKPQYNLFWKWT